MTRRDRLNPMSHPNRPPRTAAEQALAEVEAVETNPPGEEEERPATVRRGEAADATSPNRGAQEPARGEGGGRRRR